MINKLIKNCFLCIALPVLLLFQPGAANSQSDSKSASKALLYSLLVPGLGQHYVDGSKSVKFFAAAEIILTGIAIGHDRYGTWLEQDYRAFAGDHANVDPTGKQKSYFVEISKYNTIYIYNEKMRITRSYDMIIPETPENFWSWDSDENRLKYYYRRIDADVIKNRTVHYITGIFINHMVSGIHAAIMAKRYNGRKPGENSLSLKAVPVNNPLNPGFKLKLSYSF